MPRGTTSIDRAEADAMIVASARSVLRWSHVTPRRCPPAGTEFYVLALDGSFGPNGRAIMGSTDTFRRCPTGYAN